MDMALCYNPLIESFDLSLGSEGLATDDTLASAVLVALLCDRLAADYEVPRGADRRGWWADSLTDNPFKTGSRLWLLEREKQLPGAVLRCKQYCEEALQYFIDDGLARAITVTVFTPRPGWLVAMIKMELSTGSRNYRFEYDEANQRWRLAGEDV